MNRFEAIKTALPGEHDTVGCECSETALSQWEMIPSNSLFSFISILILTLFYTHTHTRCADVNQPQYKFRAEKSDKFGT